MVIARPTPAPIFKASRRERSPKCLAMGSPESSSLDDRRVPFAGQVHRSSGNPSRPLSPVAFAVRVVYSPLIQRGKGMLDPEGGVVRGTLDVLILKALSWG